MSAAPEQSRSESDGIWTYAIAAAVTVLAVVATTALVSSFIER